MTAFIQRLSEVSEKRRSLVCVGLDPDPALMAIPDIAQFNAAIIDATKDLVCAYKPNIAFYEAQGSSGLRALERTIEHIRKAAPSAVIIGDAKRGDIGSTSAMYARALFDVWGFDAATVNAWAGSDSVEPFLEYADKGTLVWCRSSNPAAAEFQNATALAGGEEAPLYEAMAARAAEWNRATGNVGLVVGATYPRELRAVRRRCAGMPILVPGVGSQGGDLEASVRSGMDDASPNLIISSSRGIAYASRAADDFASAARAAAAALRARIAAALDAEGKGW